MFCFCATTSKFSDICKPVTLTQVSWITSSLNLVNEADEVTHPGENIMCHISAEHLCFSPCGDKHAYSSSSPQYQPNTNKSTWSDDLFLSLPARRTVCHVVKTNCTQATEAQIMSSGLIYLLYFDKTCSFTGFTSVKHLTWSHWDALQPCLCFDISLWNYSFLLQVKHITRTCTCLCTWVKANLIPDV